MNEVFVLNEEFTFDGPVHEITSIAIEHKYDMTGSLCNGEFVISGDYREHEISINREDFSFHLPFNNEVRSNINLDSIEVEINDFTYEFDGNALKAHVEYTINGEQALIEFVEEADLDEFLKNNVAEVIDLSEETRVEELATDANETIEMPEERESISEQIKTIPENQEQVEAEPAIKENIKNIEEERKEILEEPKQTVVEEVTNISKSISNAPEIEKERIDQENIINSINSEDSYVTYHVHTVTASDTLETISNQYNISITEIKKINSFEELIVGMKIIIPDEED